ncbi:hypothetical protein PR048_032049 [Dryococelus australis]|uniref:Uncharacterized protein n=1 Tax=Dryococelus australis TaxID=614101 RepID=A0ABQ9G6Z8_9NEOP|nr:hypothetical protein PR048_032049 [Dryococelus australis]
MKPFNNRTQLISLDLEAYDGGDNLAEDEESSQETFMRKMGLGHLIPHTDINASDLRSLDNSDFFDIPVIKVSGHANIAINTSDVSTKYDTSSSNEVEILSNDMLVVECNDGANHCNEFVDNVHPSKPCFDLKEFAISALQTAPGSDSLT